MSTTDFTVLLTLVNWTQKIRNKNKVIMNEKYHSALVFKNKVIMNENYHTLDYTCRIIRINIDSNS